MEQVLLLARRLYSLPHKFDCIKSTKPRAMQTATYIEKRLGLHCVEEPLLEEVRHVLLNADYRNSAMQQEVSSIYGDKPSPKYRKFCALLIKNVNF